MSMKLFGSVHAQTAVTGSVYGEDNTKISGILVVQQGTSNGTITNEIGNYAISVPPDATLIFSFVGMEIIEEKVNGRSSVDVTMVTGANGFAEFVVTALGIKHKVEPLVYSPQTILGTEFGKSKDINFLNSISGRVAGADVKKSSSGVGGSTRLILRGNKSVIGGSEPLFVIDGIPITNIKGSQPGMWGGIDQGDGLSQINPEDIESISFLKGFNASVLYGAQGANGVVVLTTKNGKLGKARINISSGVTFENVVKIPELQYKYGAENGVKESWSTTAGNYNNSFVEDYFTTGVNFINSVSISGGNNKTTAYLSYSNTLAGGVTPDNKYQKNNISFKQTTKLFHDKIFVSSNIILASEVTDNKQPAGYYLNPLTGLYLFPRNGIDGNGMDYYKENYEYFREDRNMMWQNWFVQDHFQSNPYWIINNELKENKTQRVIGNLSLSWKLNDQFRFALRGSYDYAEKLNEEKYYAGSNSTNTHPNGRWDYQKYTDELIYTDAILNYNESFGNITFNAIAGASYQKMIYGLGVQLNTGINGLNYPNEFYFQNLPSSVQVHSTLKSRRQEQALFANALFGFKELLFVDITGRNDWVSNITTTENRSYFNSAIGLSTLLNEIIDMPQWISLAKARASFANGVNTVGLNSRNYYSNLSGGVVNINQSKPISDLEPEKLNSLEIGTDWRFFNGRLGLDFIYYNINSKGQFLSFQTPSVTGYTNIDIENVEIINKGIEFTIDAIPVERGQFIWKTAVNFSQNINRIAEFDSDIKWLNLGSSEGYSARIQEDGSIGDLYVYKFKRNHAGKLLFDDNGKPLRSTERELAGNLEPDWSLGWNNTIVYGKFDLSFLINARVGGKVFSQTESILDESGVSLRSGEARDLGYVTVDGVVESSGAAVTQVDPETWYRSIGGRNGIGEPYVYSRTNVRLGQFSLSYNFDLTNANFPIDALTCSLVGQNLFFIYLDSSYDPELVMSTNINAQSLDNFNLPSTRTMGFNVTLTF